MRRIPYSRVPDFTKPLLEVPTGVRSRLRSRLSFLYGESKADEWLPELERIMKVHHAHKPQALIDKEKGYDASERFTERDMVLITYGDAIKGDHGTTLAALHKVVQTYNRGAVNTIHLLPFFPYSSDRGFAVVDFKAVDPKIGTWESILNLGIKYELMVDGVMNHCSSRSLMFREFLKGNPFYEDFFITYDSPDDLTRDQRGKIFRPRTSDILTRFDTINGPKYVWTTFSDDQIDLNFRNPLVLLFMIEALLFYVRRGADILRLDAVTYLWSEPGTACVHLPQTHTIVKLLRDVMDTAAPGVALITETNVSHAQNISYFGEGNDEAHMVYNFALPPLVLYTFYSQDATVISKWAESLKTVSNTSTFFNILDTHDGVGVMGVKGILPQPEIDFLIRQAQQHGALISYKSTELGEEPYEINTTWWSAINRDGSDEDMRLQVKRYVASRSLALVLKGVPGIYTHGALAIPNDHALAERTGVKRDINRSVIDPDSLVAQLRDPGSKRSQLCRMLRRVALCRTRNRAFHPQGQQCVLAFSPNVFSVLRISPEGQQRILTMTNVTNKTTRILVSLEELGVSESLWRDLIGGREQIAQQGCLSIDLKPYDVIWLTPGSQSQVIQELAGTS